MVNSASDFNENFMENVKFCALIIGIIEIKGPIIISFNNLYSFLKHLIDSFSDSVPNTAFLLARSRLKSLKIFLKWL
ncbi:MAG: hypothetical protein ACFFDH_11210 [Promethearchaeota archaeon]